MVYIIAEAGVNHNGDPRLARRLITEAVKAGADAIKFQSFRTEEVVTRSIQQAPYQRRNSPESNQFKMLKKLELSPKAFRGLLSYGDRKGIDVFSTPYDFESLEWLIDIGVKRIKFASADIIHLPLLRRAARSKREIILSTGMASIPEIDAAVRTIEKEGDRKIRLLHCTTNYPTPYDEVNMAFMKVLMRRYRYPVGYSDHTEGIEISLMAVAQGAQIIEKHFTLDRGMPGPDQRNSVEPDELRAMVRAIRNIERAFGTEKRRLTHGERKNIKFMRRSIHARVPIPKGTRITTDMLKFVRPSDGLAPGELDRLIGGIAKRSIRTDEPIKWKDVEVGKR